MSVTPFNGDISQSLKWLQNKAPQIQTLVQSKKDWYRIYHDQFWADWDADVFDIRTAKPFGLMIWCIILGVPSGSLGLHLIIQGWAFGKNRQNFVYSGIDPSLPDPNTVGGNFYGGGSSEITILSEIRKILQLRYVALTSGGNIKYINYMLRYIFNLDAPWDFPNGVYFHVVDCTIDAAAVTTVPPAFKMEFRIGPNMGLSAQFINFVNNPANGILPSVAGCLSIAIQE